MNITLHIPQTIVVVLILTSFGMACAKHGKTVEEKPNGYTTAISSTLTLALLYWGGFFG